MKQMPPTMLRLYNNAFVGDPYEKRKAAIQKRQPAKIWPMDSIAKGDLHVTCEMHHFRMQGDMRIQQQGPDANEKWRLKSSRC